MLKKLLLLAVILGITFLSPFLLILGILIFGNWKSQQPYILPDSTAQSEIIIADSNLVSTFINAVAPTFRLESSYAAFYDEKTDTTKLIQFPSLAVREFPQFKGSIHITGSGEMILLDAQRNIIILVPKNRSEPQILYYSTDLSASGLDRLFFEPHRFVLDGKLFVIENEQLREVVAVDAYEAKFKTALTMIDSSRLNAEAYRYHARITCEDVLGEAVPEYKTGRALLSEDELDCIVNSFSKIYTNEKTFLFLVNPEQPDESKSYLMIRTDLNGDNEDYMRKIVRAKREDADFEFLDILGKNWSYYFYRFPLSKHNFSIDTIYSSYSFLDELSPGLYPRFERDIIYDSRSYETDSRNLYITPELSITTTHNCYRPSLNTCNGYNDIYTFSTPRGKTELHRFDAALVSANEDEAFFVTENGLEKVIY